MSAELAIRVDELLVLYSRYMYPMNINNPDKRAKFLKKKLNQKVLRFVVYKTFVNILPCKDFDRNVRYILPACVVTNIRAQFPNPSGEPYTGHVKIYSRDGQSLP